MIDQKWVVYLKEKLFFGAAIFVSRFFLQFHTFRPTRKTAISFSDVASAVSHLSAPASGKNRDLIRVFKSF